MEKYDLNTTGNSSEDWLVQICPKCKLPISLNISISGKFIQLICINSKCDAGFFAEFQIDSRLNQIA